ncbi:hypothetical protein FOIG_16949 [Fusarium odoratissimum NRRL 54006]|uniref:Uncharacterized protein n=1 Tax=Fusarium odoratissimum (strain NRRL 54006) TaxID=1089451 RepID=X0ILN1_FUSO5|nr:uncharacterized protein FOIG_16949 [Fusarium odoratissimum NRRL 54006]EXL89767.1 hypothetical protein FOIG_16949 [Fusarium odoratissimum NRRL 54006]
MRHEEDRNLVLRVERISSTISSTPLTLILERDTATMNYSVRVSLLLSLVPTRLP